MRGQTVPIPPDRTRRGRGYRRIPSRRCRLAPRVRVLLPLPLAGAARLRRTGRRAGSAARQLCARQPWLRGRSPASCGTPRGRRGRGLPAERLKPIAEIFAAAAAASGAAALCRPGRRLHAGAARRGAAHGDERSRGAAAAARRAGCCAITRCRGRGARRSGQRKRLIAGRRRVLEALRGRAAAAARPSSPGAPAAAPASCAD